MDQLSDFVFQLFLGFLCRLLYLFVGPVCSATPAVKIGVSGVHRLEQKLAVFPFGSLVALRASRSLTCEVRIS